MGGRVRTSETEGLRSLPRPTQEKLIGTAAIPVPKVMVALLHVRMWGGSFLGCQGPDTRFTHSDVHERMMVRGKRDPVVRADCYRPMDILSEVCRAAAVALAGGDDLRRMAGRVHSFGGSVESTDPPEPTGTVRCRGAREKRCTHLRSQHPSLHPSFHRPSAERNISMERLPSLRSPHSP